MSAMSPAAARRVLVLCTGNSCRSQLAEFLWNHLGGPAWECHSAGSQPTGTVHPGALEALAEVGVAAPRASSKSVEVFLGQRFDRVVTVCDGAQQACPVFPGAARTMHWPLMDPAHATGSPEQIREVFRTVRDALVQRIREHLLEVLEADAALDAQGVDADRRAGEALGIRLAGRMTTTLAQWPGGFSASGARLVQELVTRLRPHINRAGCDWPRLPAQIAAVYAGRGWAWNGIYARHGEELRLVAAAGPPVCATLPRRGREGSSGMCWDAVLLGQAVVADRVRRWPGYVSCDGTSGLQTRAGMAIPLRDARGTITAVWDLDSTEPLGAEDAVLLDRLLATLSALGPVDPSRLAAGSGTAP